MADNWASRNRGIVLVFCIVGVVAIGIIFFQVLLIGSRKLADAVGAKVRAEEEEIEGRTKA